SLAHCAAAASRIHVRHNTRWVCLTLWGGTLHFGCLPPAALKGSNHGAGHRTKRKTERNSFMIARYFAVGLCTCLVSLGAIAQQTMADLVAEANAEWMFGQWEAQTDSGEPVKLNVSWDLEKRVVVLHVKTSDMESKGFSYKSPSSDEVKYFS